MLEIRNTEVFGLERALKASGNAMTTGEINTAKIFDNPKKDFLRGQRLGKTPVGSGHDHYLLGVHVQFDIKYPQYWTIEAQRYHNFEIITSQSKMHRLTTMLSSTAEEASSLFNRYVDQKVIQIVKDYVQAYNDEENPELKYKWFMCALSNLPMGFEMWMTCDLTYLQLKTIYNQRKNHKLKEDWGAFCTWCEELPYFKELVSSDLS